MGRSSRPMSANYGDLTPRSPGLATHEICYGHSRDLADVLTKIGGSILISTYQAGKIATIDVVEDRVDLSFHNYDRPMGMAIDSEGRRLAVATRDAVWFAYNRPDVASRLSPARAGCFLTRSCHVTGQIQAHEIAWGEELWVANTAFSCLCSLDEHHSFRPRWTPSFITELMPEDRCHLNGLAMHEGQPKYVTVLGESNSPEGWRVNKATSGCLIDVDANQIVARDLSMPHSPVIHGKMVLLLNSGNGSLILFDSKTKQVNQLARFPGYTRGLAVHRNWAMIGLSKIRESATFGGLPISDRRDSLKCGIAIINLTTGSLEGQFEFKSGVDEIFDVAFFPRPGGLAVRGPHALQDGYDDVWLVPGNE